MKLYNAKVVDILRLHQKDEEFLNGVQSDIHSILKHTGPRNYYKLSKSVPTIANVWYYCMTTLGNLQTLGEEYTGTIRVGSDGKIPSKTLQVLWLILYVGGDPLVERLLSHSKQKIKNSTTITKDAKEFLIVCLDFFKKEKVTLRSIHNSLFYMDGAFYNISNRLTGLRYEWVCRRITDKKQMSSIESTVHIRIRRTSAIVQGGVGLTLTYVFI
ncbi:unnamed protein product [Acanthoscelides obtectus]|uniref:RING-type E3 ubiquitin transferase n=1 Tax=Acanthoscelides obtectus TaxID=200917 RepID=A0A9P0NTW0_ACAOB|nr:unnamed protein product [Acanthoscelides obtectus]CAK1668036.1 Peroxisome biogenesis factor 10 [Acanthoscelides obtectus]